MRRIYRRRRPDPKEERMAAGAALGAGAAVGLAVWYLARLWLGRERLDAESRDAARGENARENARGT